MLIALSTFTQIARASNENEESQYEPADEMCTKCNCTNVEGTLEDGRKGKLLTFDCSMRNFKHIFANWPEEVSDNGTGN